MPYSIERLAVWIGPLEDRPGALAERLKMLADAGLTFQFVAARRDFPQPGTFMVHPVSGADEARAAKSAGLSESKDLQIIRLAGADRPGLGADVTRILGDQNISARGVTAAAFEGQTVFYILLDNKQDSIKAEKALKKAKLDREEQPAAQEM